MLVDILLGAAIVFLAVALLRLDLEVFRAKRDLKKVRRLWVGRKIRFSGGATRTVTAVDRESSVITIDASVDPGP